MNASFGIAIIPLAFFLAGLLALGIVVFGVVMVVRAFVRRGEGSRLSEEEELTLRRLMEALQKMEARIVNLETILLERGGAESDRERNLH